MDKCECCDGSCGKDVRVSFCPRCKSRNVGYTFGLRNLFGVIPKMMCKDCGFDSPTFPVLITNEAELKKAIEGMKTRRRKEKGERRKIVKKVVKKKTVKNKKVVTRK